MTTPLPLPDDPRETVALTTDAFRNALEGERVAALEVSETGGYLVLRFESGATLYADAPTLYCERETASA